MDKYKALVETIRNNEDAKKVARHCESKNHNIQKDLLEYCQECVSRLEGINEYRVFLERKIACIDLEWFCSF